MSEDDTSKIHKDSTSVEIAFIKAFLKEFRHSTMKGMEDLKEGREKDLRVIQDVRDRVIKLETKAENRGSGYERALKEKDPMDRSIKSVLSEAFSIALRGVVVAIITALMLVGAQHAKIIQLDTKESK
jgi:hypothetical protein